MCQIDLFKKKKLVERLATNIVKAFVFFNFVKKKSKVYRQILFKR